MLICHQYCWISFHHLFIPIIIIVIIDLNHNHCPWHHIDHHDHLSRLLILVTPWTTLASSASSRLSETSSLSFLMNVMKMESLYGAFRNICGHCGYPLSRVPQVLKQIQHVANRQLEKGGSKSWSSLPSSKKIRISDCADSIIEGSYLNRPKKLLKVSTGTV